MKRFSILQDTKECYVCGQQSGLHIHEVFFGKNRQKSIEDGCCLYLCGKHHNLSNEGVHLDHSLDLRLKQEMQKKYMEEYGKSTEEFIERYGRNYLN